MCDLILMISLSGETVKRKRKARVIVHCNIESLTRDSVLTLLSKLTVIVQANTPGTSKQVLKTDDLK